MAKLSAILDQVDAGTVLLPEFQRGYVWNRDQVRGLMRSLYRGYPVGSLLVWETDAARQAVRGAAPASGTRSLLLDGQQRVTTLYGVVRGTPPAFFEGDPEAFRNLRFNVETEAFEFYGSVKMKDDPLWVDVTALFAGGPAAVVSGLQGHPGFFDFVDRLHRVRNVLDREVHVESITGADKTVDVVVDIFNRVNSGGTKLSRGDLALARICSDWPQARPAMRAPPRPLARATGPAVPTRTGCCATSTPSPPAVRRSPPSRTSPPRSSATRWGRRSTTWTTSST